MELDPPLPHRSPQYSDGHPPSTPRTGHNRRVLWNLCLCWQVRKGSLRRVLEEKQACTRRAWGTSIHHGEKSWAKAWCCEKTKGREVAGRVLSGSDSGDPYRKGDFLARVRLSQEFTSGAIKPASPQVSASSLMASGSQGNSLPH